MKKLLSFLFMMGLFGVAWAIVTTQYVLIQLPVSTSQTTIYVPTTQITKVVPIATYGGKYQILAYRSSYNATPVVAGTPTDPHAEWMTLNSITRNQLNVTRASTPQAMQTQEVWNFYINLNGTATATNTPAAATATATATITPTASATPTSTPIARGTVITTIAGGTPTPVFISIPGATTSTVYSFAQISGNPFGAPGVDYVAVAGGVTVTASAASTLGWAAH